jgi:hypothetical protein
LHGDLVRSVEQALDIQGIKPEVSSTHASLLQSANVPPYVIALARMGVSEVRP